MSSGEFIFLSAPNVTLTGRVANKGGPPDPSMICLHTEMLQAAAREEEKYKQEARDRKDNYSGSPVNKDTYSGPPDPSMICLYSEMLQAAASEEEKSKQAARDHENGYSGPPDPSTICLYPEMLRAAQEERK